MEPGLGPPVELDHRRGDPALACAQGGAHVGPVARVVGGLAQDVADEAIARLGDVTTVPRVATRMLGGDQTDVVRSVGAQEPGRGNRVRAGVGASGGTDERCVMFKRILVATDGSAHSRRAVLTAADLARTLGASLTLLAVYQQPPGFEGEPDYSRDLEAALRWAHDLLEAEAAAIQADGGPPAETDAIAGGQPGPAIVDVTAAGQYDLLVIGTRGHGRLGSAFLGSVSAHVAAHSPIPVLVVRGAD
jgi:nucleotide-binding universal stress UspA family protein